MACFVWVDSKKLKKNEMNVHLSNVYTQPYILRHKKGSYAKNTMGTWQTAFLWYDIDKIPRGGKLMKQFKSVLCICVLLISCAAVLLFLNIFMADADQTAVFVDFDSYAVRNEDGTLIPMTAEAFYALSPETDQVFVFEATITEENYDDYLQFTPSGMDIRVILDDTEVYHSNSVLPDGVVDQITSRVPIRGLPLPLSVTVECRILGGVNSIFPPMLLTTSDMTETIASLSWAHRSGIPTGAFAVIFLILLALFLFSIMEDTPRYSLLVLINAAAILMVHRIGTESGNLFLPQWLITLVARKELLWLLLAAFVIYFAVNRGRWRLFGWCALGSGLLFMGTYLTALASDGQFADIVNAYIMDWIEYGAYLPVLYRLTDWLQIVCLAVAVITTVHSASEHLAREQALELKAGLAMESYRVMEERSRRDAEQRHEFRNHISALMLMLEQGKKKEAEAYLAELENRSRSGIQFTDNLMINAILQNASVRAEELGFRLEAYARAEAHLNVPESDLCSLLFNMLDNAFEAVAKIPEPEKRRVTIRIKQRDLALGIYCENTYAEEPLFDQRGRLLSQKTESGHGLGVIQMERIAKKYHSVMDYSCSENGFVMQTVLFLPHRARHIKPERAETKQAIDDTFNGSGSMTDTCAARKKGVK